MLELLKEGVAMSETNITMQGLGAYIDKFTKSPDKLIERLRMQALQDAEELAGEQRANCPTDTGMLRESIQTFLERDGDVIIAGTRTNNDHAVYVEFGTGPKGTEKGHPLDSELGIVRKTEGWTANLPGIGYRYLEGRAAFPFMYEAMKKMESKIKEHYGSAVKEVLK